MQKTTFRKAILVATIAINLFFFQNAKAQQDTLYMENFDSSQFNLPIGWTTNHWIMDTTNNSNNTNASALNNVTIKNDSGSGDWFLMTRDISTIGHGNIKVLWDARLSSHFLDSGSTITSFSWTKDNGVTWNNLSYTENIPMTGSPWIWDNDSIRIPLPVTANNQPAIKFRWLAHIVMNASGTYRIDDFSVTGDTTSAGIEEANNTHFKPIVTMLPNNLLNIKLNDFSVSKIVLVITSVDGMQVFNSLMQQANQRIDLNELSSGVYIISIHASEGIYNQKIVIIH